MNTVTNFEGKINAYEPAVVNEKSKEYGKTIGEPKLSDKAAQYYRELKQKYGNMDFILVSKDMKDKAKEQAGSYANASKTVVLIDEEKIEKMATDTEYRKKYEGIISGATKKLEQLAKSIGQTGGKVKAFGVQINDGGNASFFAVVDKSLAAQRERIEEKREEKKEAKKVKEKKEAKELREEKLKESKDKKAEKTDKDDDTVTISASSVEELLQKISDYTFELMSDNVQTDVELQVGQHIDFRM